MTFPYSFHMAVNGSGLEMTVLGCRSNGVGVSELFGGGSQNLVTLDLAVHDTLWRAWQSSQKATSALFSVSIKGKKSEDAKTSGVLYHVTGRLYGFRSIRETTDSSSGICIGGQSIFASDKEVSLKAMSIEPMQMVEKVSSDVQKKLDMFSMKRPVHHSTGIHNDTATSLLGILEQTSPESKTTLNLNSVSLDAPVDITPVDPTVFLKSRYFSTLYSSNTPLSYFPKTALTRFRNLCQGSNSTMRTTLHQLILSPGQLDARHSGKLGLLTPQEDEVEKTYQTEFVDKNSQQLNSTEKSAALITELKIRETQLQMLLVIETIGCLSDGEVAFFTQQEKQTAKRAAQAARKAKRSLVRKKSIPGRPTKTIIPTFLGMGVSNQDSQPAIDSKSEDTLYATLNTLIDRMGIWDTLSVRKEGALDEPVDSSYEFLVYVLVPYFNKRLPTTIQYIVDKVKGSTLKVPRRRSSRPSAERSRSEKTESRTRSPGLGNSMELSTSTSTTSTGSTGKYNKTLLSRRPTLNQSSSILEGEDLRPMVSLKRSKSSLTSKHLQKRQVDVSKSFSDSTTVSKQPPKLPSPSKNIFGHSKRSRSTISQQAADMSFSQVAATPQKRRRSDLETSKQDNGHNLSVPTSLPPSQPVPLILSTPLRPQIPIIQATPNNTLVPPASIYSKLLSATDDIVSSPSVIPASSPAQMSSSVRSRRPGEPIAPQDSPFYRTNLHGSPTMTRKDTNPTDEDEVDSDFEVLASKTPPRISKGTPMFGRASKTYKKR
ncbi:hypothetical protein CAAN3_08S02124 [[Candida] anglica]